MSAVSCFPPTRPASASGSVNGSLVTLRWMSLGADSYIIEADRRRRHRSTVRHGQHRDDVSATVPPGRLHPHQRPQRVRRESPSPEIVITVGALPLSPEPGAEWTMGASHDAAGGVSCSGERCVPTLNPDGNFSCRCDPLTSRSDDRQAAIGACQQENRLSLQAQLGATQVRLSERWSRWEARGSSTTA